MSKKASRKMKDGFEEFYNQNFTRVFSYFYSYTGSVVRAKALAALTFDRAGEEWGHDRVPSLDRSSLFVLARSVRDERSDLAGCETPSDNGMSSSHSPEEWDVGMFISQLDPLSRELISLRFDAGLNYGEIAEVMGLSRPEIGRRILRAMSRLTALMSEV